MEGEARTEEPPADPALAGGVQLGSFLWLGVTAVTRALLATGEAGGGCLEAGLEVNLPRMFAKEEERPGVAGLAAF